MAGHLSKLEEYRERYQQSRGMNDALFGDMLDYFERMDAVYKIQLHSAAANLQKSKDRVREVEEQLENVTSCADWVATALGETRSRNPYAIAVIDANELIFLDTLIKQGAQGGARAADILHNTIANTLPEALPNTVIMAKIVVNMSGLAKTLGRDASELRDFALGFTRANAHFEFVEVGYGDDTASSKIKDVVTWHLRNVDCRQLLLGVANDATYVEFIQEKLSQRCPLSLVEGVETATAIAATNIKRVSFPKVFREDTPPPVWITSPWADDRSASPSTCTSNSSVFSSPARKSSYAEAMITSPTAPLPPPVPKAPKLKLPLPPKPAARPKIQPVKIPEITFPPVQLDWNPGLRGLDEQITVSSAGLERIKRRKDNEKLCNNHYLRGPCAKKDSCPFEHGYRASDDEKRAIAALARLNPCTAGQYCDADDCIYGHHCPSIEKGTCVNRYCKYTAAGHPPGTKRRIDSSKGA